MVSVAVTYLLTHWMYILFCTKSLDDPQDMDFLMNHNHDVLRVIMLHDQSWTHNQVKFSHVRKTVTLQIIVLVQERCNSIAIALELHFSCTNPLNYEIIKSYIRCHDASTSVHDVIEWKHFPRYWPFVRGIHRSPVNSSHKGQGCGALMFSFICAGINGWVNNREAGDLRCHSAHFDVIIMTVFYECCFYFHFQFELLLITEVILLCTIFSTVCVMQSE